MRTAILALAALALGAVLLSFALWAPRRFRGAIRNWARRSSRKLVKRHRVRIHRFKLARKWVIQQALLEDPAILDEAERHARANDLSREQAVERVAGYLDEIVPFFNIITYYKFGHWAARHSLNFLYTLHATNPDSSPSSAISRGSRLVYVMNHRSNVDYVLVAYALAEKVALSYAVGEWARVWPLEHLFRSFGSYFVRRNYREPLYHKVLERYVQLIVREGVPQGIFIEGALSRDGRLREPKIGLLDYIAGTLRDPGFEHDVLFVPLGINYDRVLEDRALLREQLRRPERPGYWHQFRETAGFLFKGALKYSRGRFQRYGYACLHFGQPLSLRQFLAEGRPDLLAPASDARKPHLKALAHLLRERIGAAVPVTPVAFLCALLLEAGPGLVSREALFRRAGELQQRLEEGGAFLLDPGRGLEDILPHGLRILTLRRLVAESVRGFTVVEEERPPSSTTATRSRTSGYNFSVVIDHPVIVCEESSRPTR
jgi:glycerol-3-phosphate O-acyltransferase